MIPSCRISASNTASRRRRAQPVRVRSTRTASLSSRSANSLNVVRTESNPGSRVAKYVVGGTARESARLQRISSSLRLFGPDSRILLRRQAFETFEQSLGQSCPALRVKPKRSPFEVFDLHTRILRPDSVFEPTLHRGSRRHRDRRVVLLISVGPTVFLLSTVLHRAAILTRSHAAKICGHGPQPRSASWHTGPWEGPGAPPGVRLRRAAWQSRLPRAAAHARPRPPTCRHR